MAAWSSELIEAEDAGGVGADVGDHGVEVDGVAGPLAHLDRLVAVHQRDHLAELDLEARRVDARGPRPRPRRLATWPWWSAPKTSITRSNPRTRNLSRW